ncbi:7834_t:CDS:2, partial [Dentiscutata erythropus]
EQSPEIKRIYEGITDNYDSVELKNLAQEKITNSNVQQFWTDITRREEDEISNINVPNLLNFASGRLRWELTSCEDLEQLDDFEKLEICPLFASTSLNGFKKDFIQRDIFDPFYCMTIDLFHDFHLWRCVLGTNFSRINSAKQFKSITLQDISKINYEIQHSFEKFDPQNISIENFLDLDISINLPFIDLTLESEISNRVKSSINEILQSWITAWKKDENLNESDYTHLFIISPLNKFLGGLLNYVTLHGPEHPTYCSYERKSHFFESLFEEKEIFDLQIFNQFSPENGQSSDGSRITDEIKDTIIVNGQNPKVYRRYSKSDSTTVVTEDLKAPEKYKKGVITSKKKYQERGEKKYGYIYPILGEVKLPGISGANDYKKNIRALNDNFNTIIKHYSKKVKKISKKLCSLFDGIKLGAIQASEGEIYLLQYVRFTSQNFGVLIDICSAKIPSKPEIRHAGQMIDFLYCVKCMVKEFMNQVKKIEEEVKRINECSDDSLEEFDNLGEFLKDNILTTPPSPKK